MKIISLAAFLASLTTAAALPIQVELAGSLLFAAGIAFVMAQDYSARRALRFETGTPVAAQFTARFFFHRPAPTPRVIFRAPALGAECHRLAA